MLLGLRTVIDPAPEPPAPPDPFATVLGRAPSVDEPVCVGFAGGGDELGPDPDADPPVGPLTPSGVPDADGIRLATGREPSGSVMGVIENPHVEAQRR